MYPGVPPKIDKETLPSESPLQLEFVIVSFTNISLGSVIIIVLENVHPLSSINESIYVPEDKLFCTLSLVNVPLNQFWYGGVPPVHKILTFI